MSSTRLPPTIDLVLGPSTGLALVVAVAYVLAIAAVFLSGLPWLARIGTTIVLAAFAIWWIGIHALRLGARSITRFVWQAEGECEWQERGGRYRRGELLPGMLVTPALVVVHLRTGRLFSRTLCMAGDAADAEGLRRLRGRLKVSPPPAPPAFSGRFARAVRRCCGEKTVTKE
ncbi:MAG: protein YgfX [Gammaproteobacteria bacterium]